MALVKLGDKIRIISLKDGIEELLIDANLDLPKAYDEDINELKGEIPAGKEFNGLSIQVIKIELEPTNIKYHPALVAIDQEEQPIIECGNWVILVCPPGDREVDRTCKKYENLDKLREVFNQKDNLNSKD